MTRWLTTLVVLGASAIVAPALAQTNAVAPVGQIEAAVAPVALYPDALLAPLLMAATYPDEVAEAGAWLAEAHNQKLKGDALAAALEPRPWDPSVKALVPFPVILDMMAQRRDWVKELGAMVVAAPASVATAVQKLRHQAIADGKLKSSPRLTVRDPGGEVTIASADPAVLYVPVYNPALVFGAWAYPDYPPMFIEPPPGFEVSGADIQTGVGFSVGYGVLQPLWGWAHPDWSNGTIEVDTAAYNRINRYGPHVAASIWHHEPHATGYFHITQAQITPPTPIGGHDETAAKAMTAAKTKTALKTTPARKTAARHTTRHAKAGNNRKAKTAHASDHRAKIRLAAGGEREHHRH
jgi:Protein of unknown function (DUF3300)